MVGIEELKAFNDVQQAYFAYVKDARKSGTPGNKIMGMGNFENWWRGLKGLGRLSIEERQQRLIAQGAVPADYFTSPQTRVNKESITMATATRKRTGPVSPYSIADVDEAYKAYLKGPWASSPNFTKPGIAKFRKMHAQRYKAPEGHVTDASGRPLSTRTDDAKRHGTLGTHGGGGEYTSNGITESQFNAFDENVQQSLIDAGAYVPQEPEVQGQPENLASVIAALVAANASPEIIAQTVASMQGVSNNSQAAEPAHTYRDRTPTNQVPEDAARNAPLWVLNVEGLLGEALDMADDAGLGYVTQEIATGLLSREFGPLPARASSTS